MSPVRISSERAIFIAALVVAAGLCLWALARHPIGYYTTLRLVVCTVSAYGIYLAIKWKREGWAFPFGALAVLFNPVVNLRITRETWAYLDVVAALLLIAAIFFVTERKVGDRQD
jgi:hypothetical protein